MQGNKDTVICIISPNKNAYSETFIRAHIERLPTKVKVLYGAWFPTFTEDGHPLLSQSVFHQAMRFSMRKIFGVASEWFQKRALQRYLKKERIEAVLAEYGPTGVAVMNVCKEAKVPLIVHFHGFDAYSRPTLEEVGQYYPKLFENAAAIIVVSYDMERQLVNLGAPREKLYYNPCGVDTSLFQGANPEEAPPTFVAVGRFVDKKAPHLTLLAFQRVVETLPEAQLIMIGDGPLWEACKELAQALGIVEAVKFLGPRPHAEVAAIMRQSRAFVQHSMKTSYGDAEGTPVAVLEAGASGLPVVATRHTGIQDVVIDGKTGFLVDEGNIEGMAEQMLQLAKDPSLAAQLGRAARERICAEFSMGKSIRKLWHIIEHVIRNKRS